MLRLRDHARRSADPVLRLQLGRLSRAGEEGAVEASLKETCAATYASPAVRWLLGDELHPGGAATTRRALELIDLRPGERLLDVACGLGASALLAAREYECVVVGIDYGEAAVAEARQAAETAGLADRADFVAGDAEHLPFADGEFDALLCECSLCTFQDKPLALAEIRRVLRPGARLALADVVMERIRLPPGLDGALATVACVGEALSAGGYASLLAGAGLRVTGIESCSDEAAELAERVHDRLRAARILGLDQSEALPLPVDEALELTTAAREAITRGALGYAIFTARR